jgi:hypothetical protein
VFAASIFNVGGGASVIGRPASSILGFVLGLYLGHRFVVLWNLERKERAEQRLSRGQWDSFDMERYLERRGRL